MAENTQSQPAPRIWGSRYRELKLLNDSEGNFAIVYLVEHVHLHTQHAMKILRTSLITEEGRRKFEQEAQIVAHLKHPHIIRVTDYGIEPDGAPFIVMDYAPNGSLRKQHPKGSKLPFTTIISYIKQLSEALHFAHNKKIIHLDIKPENMLLGEDNEVLLSDFGLAILIASSRTDALYIAGTAVYMSPEQFRGRELSAACDQYGLAVVVYEWLCGEPPFTIGDFLQLGFQHTYESPETLQEKIPSILPQVQEVVLKALSKAPKDRYPDIRAFAHALENAIKLPHEEYYRLDVALAIRNRHYEYLGVNWGKPKEITREEAEKIYISPKGTKGYKYTFTRSAIYWSEAWGAQPVWGGFAELHEELKGSSGRLGFPITAEFEAIESQQGTNGVGQRFEWDWTYHISHPDGRRVSYGATMYYSEKYGAYLTAGHIGEVYEKHGGTTGKLGFPISNSSEVSSPNGAKGYAQQFEGGRIYWQEGADNSYPTWGAIGWQYNKLRNTNGRLGFPLSAEIDIVSPTNNELLGRYQRFQGGSIYWKNSPPYDDTYPIWGAIGHFYEQQGGTSSPLGFPTSLEQATTSSLGDKGWYQNFEGGDIYWCDNHKGVVVTDAILKVFNQFDGVKGKFGFPKSPEAAVESHPELRMQEFDGGVICVVKETQ